MIISTKTYKTQTTEKAEEIWSFMYELLNKNINEFIYRFILFNDLDLQDFNFNDFDDNDIEETKLFQDNYKRA